MATTTKEDVADDVETPEPTLREQLESSFEEAQARQESESVSSEQTGSDSVRTATDRGDGRTARGQFASKQGAGSIDPAPAHQESGPQDPGGTTGSQTVSPVHGQPASQPVALPAPTSWKAEEKALWSKVPADVQQVLTRREQDVHRALTAQDEVRSIGNQFVQAATEFAPVIQARGGNPVALFREFLGIVNQIHGADPGNRAAIFRQLAAQNGVDLRGLGMQPDPSAQGQPQQPNVPIDHLIQRQVNERFQAWQRQQDQQREHAEMQATNSEIETFRSKVDATGQPAYPYFDHVTSLMASILGGGAASTLEEAYQLAVKAHPETSQLLAKAEQAQAAAKEDARRKAEFARRKAGSLRPGPGNSPQANGAGNRSIRDELKAAFEDARGRV